MNPEMGDQFLVQGGLLGWFGSLVSLEDYGNKALRYDNFNYCYIKGMLEIG